MNRKVYDESLGPSLVRLVNDVLMVLMAGCDFFVALYCIDDYTAL
jgi:hypothetical protein